MASRCVIMSHLRWFSTELGFAFRTGPCSRPRWSLRHTFTCSARSAELSTDTPMKTAARRSLGLLQWRQEDNAETEVDTYLKRTYGGKVKSCDIVQREDLDLVGSSMPRGRD
eukprot:scaffold29453_cov33-Prasinocladus_malaysianus.AAC.1